MERRWLLGGAVLLALLVIVVIAIVVPLSLKGGDDDADTWGMAPEKRADIILSRVPLVDGHNDLSYQFRMRTNNSVYEIDLTRDVNAQANFASPTGTAGHTDIPKLRAGKVGAQFWACYASCDMAHYDAVRVSLDQLDTIKKFVHRYPDAFQWVTTAQGIHDAFANKKVGSLVGLEGGHSIDSSLATLRMFYDLGVRYMTITHSCNTPWADNWMEDNDGNINNGTHEGLTDFGKDVIREMNRIGMLVDLSHVSYLTMKDAFEVAVSPVIFSHSSAYDKCHHNRNVRDDMLLKTRENGGVVMVNFYSGYVRCDGKANATLADVADHIDYIKLKAGADHVGIGADYDGVPTLPTGLHDVSTYPALFTELARRGWTDTDLEKLAGLNLIRVLEANEKVRDDMARKGVPPIETLIPDAAIPTDNKCRISF